MAVIGKSQRRYSKQFGYNDNYAGPPRKSGKGKDIISTIIVGCAKEAKRQAKTRATDAKRQTKDREKEAVLRQKIAIKQAIESEKSEKQRYINSKIAKAESLNEDISSILAELENILPYTLSVNDEISFDSLREYNKYPEFELPYELRTSINPPYNLPSRSNVTMNTLKTE